MKYSSIVNTPAAKGFVNFSLLRNSLDLGQSRFIQSYYLFFKEGLLYSMSETKSNLFSFSASSMVVGFVIYNEGNISILACNLSFSPPVTWWCQAQEGDLSAGS